MKIYRLDFDVNNYKGIQLCEEADFDYYHMFDGTSLKDNWTTRKVEFYEEDEELKEGDAPGFNIPVFNKRALEVLFPLIKDEVELLELQLGDEILYGINVLKIIDAVNYDLSEYRTFRDGKRIMAFKKYVFRNEMIIGTNIFKIVDLPRGDVFVSEDFYNYVINNNLEGFKMELVYES
ncbi:hypothetical protein D6856_10270 [Butyrivibrio sp. XB500-5]|uniref:imm11 family protein n=1 Tax=Butyrivibrio sp. XB500-5 TaxID=2364880 RepID=UPI000EA8EC65|nr:DUF1629 domain-containing protein [Butyrivibrio sp. XB500-5]RKM59591.1 hypothetical protein D6856_10270 [Butyrivibrio sp. XB500-5]